MVDRIDTFVARWKVPLTVASAAWFVVSCAADAGFISLPFTDLANGLPAVVVAGGWNAMWWGWFYPRAEQRRYSRSAQEPHEDG